MTNATNRATWIPEIHFLRVPEAGSQRSRCRQGGSFWRFSPWLIDGCLHVAIPLCISVSQSLLIGWIKRPNIWPPMAFLVAQQRICLQCRRPGFDPWAGKIPWRSKWQPTPVFPPAESHGQRSLAGYSPWGHKELDTTKWLTHMTLSELNHLFKEPVSKYSHMLRSRVRTPIYKYGRHNSTCNSIDINQWVKVRKNRKEVEAATDHRTPGRHHLEQREGTSGKAEAQGQSGVGLTVTNLTSSFLT